MSLAIETEAHSSITEFIGMELKKIEDKYESDLLFTPDGELSAEDEGRLQRGEGVIYPFYTVMLGDRQALNAIGDKNLINPMVYTDQGETDHTTYRGQYFLHAAFNFFNESMEIFNSILNDKMREFLSENPDALILPPKEQLHSINSKIGYLEILKQGGFISPDTQVLLPLDTRGNNINFQDGAHFTELQGYLEELGDSKKNYNKKDFKRSWLGKMGVIKLPYAGNSECVVYPNIKYNKNQGNYIYWLAVYLWSSGFVGRDNDSLYTLKCLGFTRGIIVDRYNPLISSIGEFRTFVSNGDVIGISYGSEYTGRILALLFNRYDEAGAVETIYNPVALQSLREAFLKGRMVRFWKTEDSDTQNFKRLFLDQIKTLSGEINTLLNLNCNRLDFCVNHSTIDSGEFNLMINEVEDMAYGFGSIMGFMIPPYDYNMKGEQVKHLKTRYPEVIDVLKENQRAHLQSLAAESGARMDADMVSEPAPDTAPESELGGGGGSKRRKSKRRKSKRRKSKRRKSKRRKSKRRKSRIR